MLPVVKGHLAPDADGPLDTPPVTAGEINPISPDPPDHRAFPSDEDLGTLGSIDVSAPTGQIDALTPEMMAAIAAAGEGATDQPEATDQHDLSFGDDAPTAATSVVDAPLAEDDLAPLDPEDGAEPPPTIAQSGPGDQAAFPPIAAEPDAETPPATAEFSLADIAAQANPDDTPASEPDQAQTDQTQTDHAQPDRAEPELPPITAEPDAERPPATAEFSLADIAAQANPDDTPAGEPALDGIEIADVEIEDVEFESVGVESVETADVEIADVEIADVESADVEIADVEIADVEIADVEIADVEIADVEIADVEIADVEIADVESADVEIDASEPARVEMVEPDTGHDAADGGFPEIDLFEFEALMPEAEPASSEPAGPEPSPPDDALADVVRADDPPSPPKRRGFLSRRRDRRRAATDDHRSFVEGSPTGVEAPAVAGDDEPIFISPGDSLFDGSEPTPNPVSTATDEPRRRRNVTLPPDTAQPESWDEPALAQPSDEPAEPVVAAAPALDEPVPPLDEGEALFADPLTPTDDPTSSDPAQSIAWATDAPKSASDSDVDWEQPYALFDTDHRADADAAEEVAEAPAADEAISEPPTEALPWTDGDADGEPPTEATPQIENSAESLPERSTDGPDFETETETETGDNDNDDDDDDDDSVGGWTPGWADVGWADLDQAEAKPDEDPAAAAVEGAVPDLVLFPDEFPSLPLDEPDPSAAPQAAAVDGDWAGFPTGDEPVMPPPDTLSLFETEASPGPDGDRVVLPAGLPADSEFFSLQTMLDGLPDPEESASIPLAAERLDVARSQRPDLAGNAAGPTFDLGSSSGDFFDLAELPEEPGRLLEEAVASASTTSRAATGATDTWSDYRSAQLTAHDDVFGELADLDGEGDDVTGGASDRAGERVERHDWWDYDDATQRDDDRGGFRAAANATEAIDFSGTEELSLDASDLAAPPTFTKPSDLDALDGPDSDAYEAALYAFFDAPDSDESDADELEPELDEGPDAKGKRKRKGKRRAKGRSSKGGATDHTPTPEPEIFANAQALADDDRDDVDRWVEGTTDTHADWLERTKRSTFANLLGLLIALAAAVGVVLATVWVVNNI